MLHSEPVLKKKSTKCAKENLRLLFVAHQLLALTICTVCYFSFVISEGCLNAARAFQWVIALNPCCEGFDYTGCVLLLWGAIIEIMNSP